MAEHLKLGAKGSGRAHVAHHHQGMCKCTMGSTKALYESKYHQELYRHSRNCFHFQTYALLFRPASSHSFLIREERSIDFKQKLCVLVKTVLKKKERKSGNRFSSALLPCCALLGYHSSHPTLSFILLVFLLVWSLVALHFQHGNLIAIFLQQ